MYQKLKRYKYLYLLMIPGVIWYAIFHIWPLYGIVIAFQDFRPIEGITGSQWVGLKHFQNLFVGVSFWRILKNTLTISFLKLFFGFPAPIILALSLHAIGNKYFKRVVQTMSYLPNFLSWVIISGIAFALFNDYYGLAKDIFEVFGLKYVNITTSPNYFIPFLVASSIWKRMGMDSIIYIAALSGIDPQLYEAATIDGANRWKQLLHITIPSIMFVCAIVLILSVGGLLTGDFEQIFLFAKDNPSLTRISDIFETYIYRNGIRAANFSEPAAVGIFQSFFGALLILTTNKIAKKLGYEGIW